MSEMRKGAVLSECGTYRYSLSRTWDDTKPSLHFVMLNPSTADANEDDPTIRRCMGFARRDNLFGGIYVVNLFAYRATNPEELYQPGTDIEGPENRSWWHLLMSSARESNSKIVCAWGAQKVAKAQGIEFMRMAFTRQAHLHCLGKSQNGDPKHPLYLKSDQPFLPYGWSEKGLTSELAVPDASS